MDGSVSGAAATSPEGQEQLADAVQQTTGFTPAAEAADAPLREDQIQNAVAFLAHPKVVILSSGAYFASSPILVRAMLSSTSFACAEQLYVALETQGRVGDLERSTAA